MRNNNNICFMIVALRMVAHMPRMVNEITLNDTPLARWLQALSRAAWSEDAVTIESQTIERNVVEWVTSYVRSGSEQGDAHEFLRHLLSDAKIDPLLSRHMGGTVVHVKTCTACNSQTVSETEESVQEFQLNDLQRAGDLSKGILSLYNEEVMDGSNAVHCERCKMKTRTTRRRLVKRWPRYLLLHLCRFKYTNDGARRSKLTHHFQLKRQLHITTRANKQTGEPEHTTVFKLIFVILHHGRGSQSGHYTAYGRVDDKTFLSYNDDIVTKAPANFLNDGSFQADTYMVLFERDVEK